MANLGSNRGGLGSARTGADVDPTPAGAGGPWPGNGGAPPPVAAASAAGSAATTSHSDHTHAGVASVAAAAESGIVVGGTASAPTVSQRLSAAWDPTVYRVYAVDYDAGNDASAGFATASANTGAAVTAAIAAAGAVALKTLEQLGNILPRNGQGRKLAIIICARAAGATYLKKDAVTTDSLDSFMVGLSGYDSVYVWATGTNATAGATKFTGDTPDFLNAGAIPIPGTNAAGYNPTGAATTVVIPCLQVGGAAPGLGAEPNAPGGYAVRYDSATATAALRNQSRGIVQVSTTTTANDTVSVPAANAFPAAGGVTDVFYLEQPGVVVGAYGLGWNAAPGRVVTIVGIRSTGAVNYSPGPQGGLSGLVHMFCGGTGLITQANDLTCTHQAATPTGVAITRGASFRSEGAIQIQMGQLVTLKNTYSKTFTFLENVLQAFMTQTCVCGTFLQVLGGGLSTLDTQAVIGGIGGSNNGGRVLGSGITLQGCRAAIGDVAVTGSGGSAAVRVSGTCDILLRNTVAGSTGNTDVGLDLSQSYGSRIVTQLGMPSVSGVTGDVRLAGGFIVSWASLGLTGVVDVQGNRIQSGTPPMSPVMFTGKLTSGVAAVHTYCACSDAPTANVANPFLFPQAMRIARRLRVFVQGALGVTTTFTVYRGGVATAITCTVVAGASIGLDDAAAHAVLFTDGDQLDVRADAPIDGVAPGDLTFAAVVEFLS